MQPGARTDVRPPLRFTLPELRLGFGAWAVGGAGWGAPGAERDRAAAVERAVERGITFFDTAPSYGDGASELLVGRLLKPHGERVARERGLAFLAYRPLAAGLLSGKYAAPPEFPAGDHRRGIYWFRGPEFARRRAVIEQLRPIAQRLDLSLPALALAWVLGQPGVGVVLAGARTREQVDEHLTGTRHVTPDTLAAVDALVAEAFRLPHATDTMRAQAATWGERERRSLHRLDGTASAEAIAAAWTDRGEKPMVAAQVKVFCDQLAEQGLVVTDTG